MIHSLHFPRYRANSGLFNDSTKAKCALCHLTTPTSYASTDKILFTDYSYDNTGLPKNPLSKTAAIDSGVAKAEMFVKIEESKFVLVLSVAQI